jgi:ketosteroid isomerase-like protein
MSQENVETIRRCFDAYQGPNPEAALDFYDPTVEFDATDRPDGRVWQGRDGIRQAMTEWSGTWAGWTFEIEELIDLDDDRVLALWREWGTGKGSGIPMEQDGGSVFTLRGGLIVKWVAHIGRGRALRAAGLSD